MPYLAIREPDDSWRASSPLADPTDCHRPEGRGRRHRRVLTTSSPPSDTQSFAESGLTQRGGILLAGDGANDLEFRYLMADTITIPSPRVFLTTASPVAPAHESPKPASAVPKPKQQRKRNSATAKAKILSDKPSVSNGNNGVEKKKQSKSRNGCVTCKAKRLKCDEQKPSCQQCARRNVDCGGYRKDYKWRPFGETILTTGRPPGTANAKPKKEVTFAVTPQKPRSEHPPSPPDTIQSGSASPSEESKQSQVAIAIARADSEQSFTPLAATGIQDEIVDIGLDLDLDDAIDMFEFEQHDTDLGVQHAMSDPTFREDDSNMQQLSTINSPHGLPLDSFLSLSTYFGSMTSAMDFESMSGPLLTPMSMMDQPFFPDHDDGTEDIVRPGYGEFNQPWSVSLPDFYQSSVSSIMTDSSFFSAPDMFSVPRGIDFSLGSPEMLTLRFDRQTCGILSVKDGPTENPWRTLIWPLARDCPTLYHAIASMTSFHTSKNQPELRLHGIDHMRISIENLGSGIATMRFDTAIATTLALAFAESWDQHISTGINHIKGAKILVGQALIRHQRVPFRGEELERLKFLTNAWVYMDVLARLTSADNDESNDFDAAYSKLANSFDAELHLDPLMGAASTLFPLVGRVANLVRRVRRSKSNSPSAISHAMELKKMLQEWEPPSVEEIPEDPTIDTEHTLQTAEAYRWATLLYLHQAVPEIPSASSAELGKKVMIFLATVPLSSRTVIVHIYPLIAASCEAVDEEDRQWVSQRWMSMAQRMKIGVIDRCADVVKEVWQRRDQYEMDTAIRRNPPLKRGFGFDADGFDGGNDMTFAWNNSDPFGRSRKRRPADDMFDLPKALRASGRKVSRDDKSGDTDVNYTVRGRLHWLGVMKDWGWEVLLG
ncbi:putative c6 finger domain-containing protein [Venturia nashicola]|uniref:Putative c6 finger domain-containing protein n=1 Tax=Venturia nashicola TaxID=86259 RepID=A0A4Z1NK66_9PEZI|nr:putative c6 finger domain-containing protein [Venturia nashicola]